MFSTREAKIEDCPLLEQIEKACFKDPWNVGMLESEVVSDMTTYNLFLCDESVVGYYSYLHIFDEAHIMNVAILPEYQGLGYGNAMMKSLLDLTAEQGLPNVTLEVRKSNVKAINLYEKHGFNLVGVRPKYYMDGEDALIYWLYRE